MGMYDEIINKDGALECPEGHAIKKLQTKDFECTYVLEGGRLKLQQRPSGLSVSPFPRATELQGDHEVEAHSFCEECFPLHGPRRKTWTHPSWPPDTAPCTDHGPLWLFTLKFQDGKLVDVMRAVDP